MLCLVMSPILVWQMLATVLTRLECAYGLKYVELNHRNPNNPWSTRQTAVYHQFSCGQETNSSTWVLVATSKRTKHSVGRYVRGSSDLTALNPFEIHLIILDTSLANWRPCIVYLTEQITKQVGDGLVYDFLFLFDFLFFMGCSWMY